MKLFFYMMLIACFLVSACSDGNEKPEEKQEEIPVQSALQLIILGGPGAGKGTQADTIKKAHNLGHLSTGKVLREEVAKGTELGKLVEGVMQRGDLVADSIILELVEQRLNEPPYQHGFILDGFPRTIPQAVGLEKILDKRGDTRIHVLYLEVSDEEMARRLLSRGRADDTEETIKNRIATFHEQTDPLVEYYEKAGSLLRINGEQSIENVTQEIMRTLAGLDRSSR